MMESSLISLKSSWHPQGPYDIQVCHRGVFEGELGVHEENTERRSWQEPSSITVVLATAQSDTPGEPCFLKLRSKSGVEIVSAVVLSDARVVELYDDVDGYVRTVRGELLRSSDGEEGSVVYRKEIRLDRPHSSFSLKFVSLADKDHLHLHQIRTTLRRGNGNESCASHLPGHHGNIDMDHVRNLLSSQQPISERAENLMSAVEQYQRNQSSVMQGLQEAVADSAANQKQGGGGGDAGMMGQMASLLSSLSRTRLNEEQVPPSSEAIMKMLSLQGGGGDSPGNDSMYGALKVMCRDVTSRRSQDRQKRSEKPCDEEGTREDRPSREDSKSAECASLAERLKPVIDSMEERLAARFEERLASLQTHLDLRLNRLETMLSDLALQRPGTSSSSSSEGRVGNGEHSRADTNGLEGEEPVVLPLKEPL